MDKQQKEILESQLNDEKAVLKSLEAMYRDALAEINSKIELLMARQDADMQHVIYQVQYQQNLKTQIQAILETLQANEFESISEYLTKSYEEGFLGTMYTMQAQGVPLIFPIDQSQVVNALMHETKLSETLYAAMGHDIKDLQKKIAGEISRGIAGGQMYSEIARNIASWARIPKNNAMRITRTEAHRIQCKAAYDAQQKAKSRGADVVRQWDASLDGRTRDSHRKVDGEIREIGEKFSNGLEYPGDPSGRPEEVINCRCALLTRARWALDREETKYLGNMDGMSDKDLKPLADKLHMSVDELRTYQGQIVPINAKSYEDFKRQYNKIWRYEGSDLQKQAEARIAGYKSERVRSGAQKMNDMDQSDVIKGIKNKMNKANEHSPLPLSKLSGKYKDDIQRICNQAPDNIKKLYGKYENKVNFINEKQLGRSVASKKGISVNFKKDSINECGAWATTFHEIGHGIERAAGNAVEKYPDFKKSLVADFADIVNSYQKMYNVTKSEAYKSIGKVLEEPKFHSISDLVGGITNNKCLGGYGHDNHYWSLPYKLEREAFAHFYEATARNDLEKLDAIKAMFPSAYAMFERMVDEI